jgi:hypothetical protein
VTHATRRAVGGLVAGLFVALTASPTLAQNPDLPFKIDLPPGFTIQPPRKGPDFDVYFISKDGVAYVGVYAGNAPQFADTDGRPRADGGPSDRTRGGGVDDASLEYLIQTGRQFPSKLHIWTLRAPDQATAVRLAASVRVAGQ